MWNFLHDLWRSVLRPLSTAVAPESAGEVLSQNALRDELRGLVEERMNLKKTAASYGEFGYHELVNQVHRQLFATDRRIALIRDRLRRKQLSSQG
jgi:hypothetical protein